MLRNDSHFLDEWDEWDDPNNVQNDDPNNDQRNYEEEKRKETSESIEALITSGFFSMSLSQEKSEDSELLMVIINYYGSDSKKADADLISIKTIVKNLDERNYNEYKNLAIVRSGGKELRSIELPSIWYETLRGQKAEKEKLAAATSSIPSMPAAALPIAKTKLVPQLELELEKYAAKYLNSAEVENSIADLSKNKYYFKKKRTEKEGSVLFSFSYSNDAKTAQQDLDYIKNICNLIISTDKPSSPYFKLALNTITKSQVLVNNKGIAYFMVYKNIDHLLRALHDLYLKQPPTPIDQKQESTSRQDEAEAELLSDFFQTKHDDSYQDIYNLYLCDSKDNAQQLMTSIKNFVAKVSNSQQSNLKVLQQNLNDLLENSGMSNLVKMHNRTRGGSWAVIIDKDLDSLLYKIHKAIKSEKSQKATDVLIEKKKEEEQEEEKSLSKTMPDLLADFFTQKSPKEVQNAHLYYYDNKEDASNLLEKIKDFVNEVLQSRRPDLAKYKQQLKKLQNIDNYVEISWSETRQKFVFDIDQRLDNLLYQIYGLYQDPKQINESGPKVQMLVELDHNRLQDCIGVFKLLESTKPLKKVGGLNVIDCTTLGDNRAAEVLKNLKYLLGNIEIIDDEKRQLGSDFVSDIHLAESNRKHPNTFLLTDQQIYQLKQIHQLIPKSSLASSSQVALPVQKQLEQQQQQQLQQQQLQLQLQQQQIEQLKRQVSQLSTRTDTLELDVSKISQYINSEKRRQIATEYLNIEKFLVKRWKILEGKPIQLPHTHVGRPLEEKLFAVYKVLRDISIQECWGQLDKMSSPFRYGTLAQLKAEHKEIKDLKSTTLDTVGQTMITVELGGTFEAALNNLTGKKPSPTLFEKYFNKLTEVLSESVNKKSGWGPMFFRSDDKNIFYKELLTILQNAQPTAPTPETRPRSPS